MPLESSYGSRPSGSGTYGGTGPVDDEDAGEYWSLPRLRRCYSEYLFSKRSEIDEQIDARRYYHGSQYKSDQIAEMKKRKAPVMTFNRVARKIDGVCGLIERLRQDPKAYPRTPQHEQGAELSTAAIRYSLDENEWKAKSPQVAQDGAVDGIGGIEIELTQGDKGDRDIGFEIVDVPSFFYDPQSYQADFADALYMGVGKWVNTAVAREMFPDAPPEAFSGHDFDLVGTSDRELRWYSMLGVTKRCRIVDIWYRHKNGWCYSIFTGNCVLVEGRSYLKDNKKKEMCKYIMFSGNVDQDGDRYGFIRNMKSAQDGINARQSKMQHILNSKRLILSQGAVADVEAARREWARPDGVIVTNRPVNDGVKADDQSFDFAGWTKMLEMNLAEIENFGPNPALIGQGIENKSGRAIQLLQQAGIAELGPYILAFRGWKIRVYRALWNAIQQHWQAERWIRVTDDEGVAQFVKVNGMGIDPQTGTPTLINAVGSLDVDVILDEGPDHVNMQQDSYEVMQSLGPQFGIQFPEIALELSPIQASVKKKMLDKLEQMKNAPPPPDPKVEAMQIQSQLKMQEMQAGIQVKQQESQLGMQTRAQESDQEMQIEAAKAAQQMQIEREKMALQMQCDAEKHQMECANDAQKNQMQAETETQRSAQKLDSERQMIEIKIEGAKSARKEETREPAAELASKAIERMAEAIEKQTKILSAPKKAIYDAKGRITHSETVLTH